MKLCMGLRALSKLGMPLGGILLLLLVGSGTLCCARSEAQAEADGRIHMDVVVTDAAGKPASGLEAQDFTIFDDGKERPVAAFAAFDAAGAKSDPPAQMIIVIDTINNGFVEMGYMRQGLQAFLRENGGQLQQPTRIAQLSLSGIQLVAQPSRDGNALANVVNKLGATVRPRGLDTLQVSIDALFTLVKQEANEPGRKLLVWLGPGWATPLLPQGAFTQVDERNQRTYFTVARQIQELLYASHVVLYGGYSGGEFYMRDFLKPVRKIADMDPRALRLNVLAIKSGGKGELPETNRDRVVTDTLDHFAAEANTYYSLAFEPAAAKSADEFHELRVMVNRPGLTARTITGYYGEPAKPREEPAKLAPVIGEKRPFEAPEAPAKLVTVAQLGEMVESLKGKEDGEAAKEIEPVQLTERLSSARLSAMKDELPGGRSRSALTVVGDASVFLDLPKEEIDEKAPPDLAEQRRIVSLAVDYLGKTLPKLPNFSARRTTVSFEAAGPNSARNGAAARGGDPMHRVGEAAVTILYRDGKEVVQEDTSGNGATEKHAGLVTQGIFGPVLSTVVVDASHGEMKWHHWEEGANGRIAVFAYRVSGAQSHYAVSYAGFKDKNAGQASVRTAYHGEIGIEAASGTIVRLALEADLASDSPMRRADIMVEYGAAEIGGKTYTCPLRSVSISAGQSVATAGRNGAESGRDVTRLNDVTFDRYHVFRSEMRILPE